jgi:hypothetical protein
MGAGLILVPLSILIYVPILIWSITFFYKSRALSKLEREHFSASIAARRSIVLFYVMAIVSNEHFATVIWHAIGHTINEDWYWLNYWLKHDIKTMLFGWDAWSDIIYYWISILIAYLIGFAIAYSTEKSNKGRLYKCNAYKLAIAIIFIHPFIIISMLSRLFGWEPIVNKWLGL